MPFGVDEQRLGRVPRVDHQDKKRVLWVSPLKQRFDQGRHRLQAFLNRVTVIDDNSGRWLAYRSHSRAIEFVPVQNPVAEQAPIVLGMAWRSRSQGGHQIRRE